MISGNVTEERCDSCRSEAYVRFAFGPPGSPNLKVLDFCGHHANHYELPMVASGWAIVIDNREALKTHAVSRPTDS